MERDSLEEALLPPATAVRTGASTLENGITSNNNPKKPTRTGDSSINLVLLLSTFVAISGSFGYGCSVGYSSPAQSGIMKDLGLSVSQYSVFGSIVTIGGMIGAILSGKIADLIGRRRTMWLAQIFCVPGWLIIAFAKNAWWLDIGRLSSGLGVGLNTYVIPVYIAEITPKNVRGRYTTAYQLMTSVGYGTVYFIGTILPWRTLSLIPLIAYTVQFLGLFWIPESPRWLAKRGHEKEFKTALKRLRGRKADIDQEAAEIIEILEALMHTAEARTLELFHSRYAYTVFVGVGLMAMQQFGGDAGLSYYAGSVFTKLNFSAQIGTTTLAFTQVPFAILGLLLMDIYGRRTLLMVSSGVSCLSFVVVGLSFYLQEFSVWKDVTPILSFFAIVIYIGGFVIGMAVIPWLIMSEIFPLNIKASAGSLVTLTNWSCSWLVTFTFNFMLQWSSTGTFFIFAAIDGLTVLFVWKFVPETKGRTLEEIQATMTHLS